jgi:dCMP deaminase
METNITYDKWIGRFLNMAALISTWSKDPSTQVGAIITDNQRRIVSMGYNGLPKEVIDHKERYEDREKKYKIIVHAEMNAMIFAQRSLKGCILYTWPFPPCAVCTGAIIQHGIDCVIAPEPNKELKKRWKEDLELSEQMLHEAHVGLIIVK